MKDFIELIKANAKNYPNRIAVMDSDKKINYADFLLLVDAFSNHLLPKSKVVIDLEQGVEAYALIVAVLNVGGTYCPLSPMAPIERKRQIITDFLPDLIIVSSESKKLDLSPIEAITPSDLLNNKNTVTGKRHYSDDDIIYIIYTSGSTGIPKGVRICRKALNKFLEWAIPAYGAGENDVWGQYSYLSFDLSIVDIFTCLCSGATLFAMNDIPAKIYRPDRLIDKVKITIWHSVPSAVEFMIKNDLTKRCDFSSLKVMSFCGEPLRKHQVEFLFEKNCTVRIFNTYGPTEGTLFCTWQELNAKNYLNFLHYSMSIGKPIPNWNLLLHKVDGFEEKEIIIYGSYIGKGYLGDIGNSKFKKIYVDNELVECFETGDLVKEVNGNLYFSCRKDNQIKLKGQRIELDEIDFRITQFLNVTSATIEYNGSLYSFIESEAIFEEAWLRSELKTVLEDYKIPNVFFRIHEIPRNQNQKVDNKKLKQLINDSSK